MPRTISNDGLPYATTSVIVVAVYISLITRWARVFSGGKDVDRLACICAIHVPDIDLAIVRARVDVAAIGTTRRTEVASNKSFEHAMASECNEGAVVRMWLMVGGIIEGEAVVEVRGVILKS